MTPPLHHDTSSPSGLSATFLGISTVLLDDGTDSILIDGYFTRPGPVNLLLSPVGPDLDTVNRVMNHARVRNLRAVLVAHAHHDHALDSAAVASMTGAQLIGSTSVLKISPPRGMTMPATDRLIDGKRYGDGDFGAFGIVAYRAEHSPGEVFPGDIKAPLQLPVHATALRGGENYSLLIIHKGTRILVVPAASPGCYSGVRADIVILSVGRVGKHDEKWVAQYWSSVVREVGAKRVVLTHWDDFTAPLQRPLKPMFKPFDRVDKGLKQIIALAIRDKIEVQVPDAYDRIDLSRSWPETIGDNEGIVRKCEAE